MIGPDQFAEADLTTRIILAQLEMDIAAMLDVEFHRPPGRQRSPTKRPGRIVRADTKSTEKAA